LILFQKNKEPTAKNSVNSLVALVGVVTNKQDTACDMQKACGYIGLLYLTIRWSFVGHKTNKGGAFKLSLFYLSPLTFQLSPLLTQLPHAV
jgi:hypothetical protein